MSKLIRDCIGFALLRSVIGLEISRHLRNQSDAKLNQSRLGYTRFPALVAGSSRLRAFTLSSHWLLLILLLLLIFVLIGCCDYFWFWF